VVSFVIFFARVDVGIHRYKIKIKNAPTDPSIHWDKNMHSCGATQITGIKPISRHAQTRAIAFTGESRRALLGEMIPLFFPPSQVHST